MNAQQYSKWSRPFREDGRLYAVLKWGNKLETYLFYVLYPLLLVLLLVGKNPLIIKAVAVPAISFALVTILRLVVNRKRPYEALHIEPLIIKDTKGKSFPSRHVFSVYMIAMAWLAYCLPVGVILLVLGIDMMFIRVVGGVHYPEDVLAGAAIGVAAGLIGFWLL